VVTATVTHAAPHHLVADAFGAVRRTRGGDAWEAAQVASCGTGAGAGAGAVVLGMPAVRAGG
jgi:tRNA-2-methylthio-N6-dimethylallyladenosine synthase